MKRLIVIIIGLSGLLLSGCKSQNTQSSQSAQYSFASPSPSEQSAAGEVSDSLVNAIKSQLATKYNKDTADINLVVNQELPEFASGAVNFIGEMGGALWFAAKTKGGWLLVHDGQGPMLCELAEQYALPTSMVPQCMSGDQIVKRSDQ